MSAELMIMETHRVKMVECALILLRIIYAFVMVTFMAKTAENKVAVAIIVLY